MSISLNILNTFNNVEETEELDSVSAPHLFPAQLLSYTREGLLEMCTPYVSVKTAQGVLEVPQLVYVENITFCAETQTIFYNVRNSATGELCYNPPHYLDHLSATEFGYVLAIFRFAGYVIQPVSA